MLFPVPDEVILFGMIPGGVLFAIGAVFFAIADRVAVSKDDQPPQKQELEDKEGGRRSKRDGQPPRKQDFEDRETRRRFKGRCIGEIKKAGIEAKGSARFAAVLGKQAVELDLEKFYASRNDPQIIENLLAEARKLAEGAGQQTTPEAGQKGV